MWSPTNYLISTHLLTEDDKEERAEDEGADDEGADDKEARCYADDDEGFQVPRARASNVLMTSFIVSHEHHVNITQHLQAGADCSHRAITMLVEVFVKMACWSTTVIDCSHKVITMQLIVVEVATCECSY